MTVGRPAVGAMTVACPSCRAVAGRPCVDSRGYLYPGGAHVLRHQDWLAAEEREQAEEQARRARRSAGSTTAPVN